MILKAGTITKPTLDVKRKIEKLADLERDVRSPFGARNPLKTGFQGELFYIQENRIPV